MDILRNEAIKKLRDGDPGGRLGLYYAAQEGLGVEDSIKIHSKLMIVDDRFVRIGSANLNNRSMGFDTELDLAVEIDEEPGQAEKIRDFRNRLLGEHLGVRPSEVEEKVRRTGSLLRGVEELRGNSRTLETLHVDSGELVDLVAEEQDLFDPEGPIEARSFLRDWQPFEELSKKWVRLIQLAVLLLVLAGAALAWRFTPLQEYISRQTLAEMVALLQQNRLAWLYVLTAYAAGSLLMVPLMLLIILTAMVFGIYQGAALALVGGLASGTITYWLGRIMGRDTVRSLAGDKINTLSRRLGRSGIFSTFVVRLMPVAPYSIVNIVAGASHIRFRDFIIGTALGLMPGILAICLLVDRGYALLSDPGLLNIFSAAAVAAAIALSAYYLRRHFKEQ
jgi:uncharacterized membrane protein YdjX (TVP38/TMEM64 family)